MKLNALALAASLLALNSAAPAPMMGAMDQLNHYHSQLAGPDTYVNKLHPNEIMESKAAMNSRSPTDSMVDSKGMSESKDMIDAGLTMHSAFSKNAMDANENVHTNPKRTLNTAGWKGMLTDTALMDTTDAMGNMHADSKRVAESKDMINTSGSMDLMTDANKGANWRRTIDAKDAIDSKDATQSHNTIKSKALNARSHMSSLSAAHAVLKPFLEMGMSSSCYALYQSFVTCGHACADGDKACHAGCSKTWCSEGKSKCFDGKLSC